MTAKQLEESWDEPGATMVSQYGCKLQDVCDRCGEVAEDLTPINNAGHEWLICEECCKEIMIDLGYIP